MNKHTTQSIFFHQEIILIRFFLKKYFKDLRTIICIIVALIPPIISYSTIQEILKTTIELDQIKFEYIVFWGYYINLSYILYYYLTIIIASDIISGDFSNKTAMVLYSMPVSRKRIVISKILSMIIYIAIFELISFIIFGILSLITVNITPSLESLILGFFILFINILFALFLSSLISALTRNTIISVLIPFFYVYLGNYLFSAVDMEALSYTSLGLKLINVIQNSIQTGTLILESEEIINLILLFLIPLIIFIIIIYVIKQRDIRT